jgi:hypothetical protein
MIGIEHQRLIGRKSEMKMRGLVFREGEEHRFAESTHVDFCGDINVFGNHCKTLYHPQDIRQLMTHCERGNAHGGCQLSSRQGRVTLDFAGHNSGQTLIRALPCLKNGRRVAKDPALGYGFITRSAGSGNAFGQSELALCLWTRRGT